MTKKENPNLAAKVILISKKTEYEVAESINEVLETEKENSNKLNYLPEYIDSLYKLYFERAINLTSNSNSILQKNTLNKEQSINLYNQHINEYKNNSKMFGRDLDRLLQLIGLFTKTKIQQQEDNDLFLYEVLSKRLEYIVQINLESQLRDTHIKHKKETQIKKKKKKH